MYSGPECESSIRKMIGGVDLLVCIGKPPPPLGKAEGNKGGRRPRQEMTQAYQVVWNKVHQSYAYMVEVRVSSLQKLENG